MGEVYASLFADYEGIRGERTLELKIEQYWRQAAGTPPADAPPVASLHYLSQRKLQRFNHSPKDVRLHSLVGKTRDGLFIGYGQNYFWMGTVEDVVMAIRNWYLMEGSETDRDVYDERAYSLCHDLREIAGIDLREEHHFVIPENERQEPEKQSAPPYTGVQRGRAHGMQARRRHGKPHRRRIAV